MNSSLLIIVESCAGGLLMLLVLLDVFLTVLYARAGYAIFSRPIARATWWLFRKVAQRSGPYSGRVLSFCGPVILVFLVAGWAFLLSLGAALIVHQRLGTEITAQSGTGRTDFVTAYFVGNASLSIVSSSGYSPRTDGAKLLYVFDSVVGASVLSLTLTYLMQVYSALNQRNALAFKVHLSSNEKGDAAELIVGVGARGHFEPASRTLDDLSSTMIKMKETHHLYPVLFYFRFPETYYSISRFTFVALDTATLLRTALSKEHDWLKDSGTVQGLARSAELLVGMLLEHFVPTAGRPQPAHPDPESRQRWTERYAAALDKFQKAGIPVRPDPAQGSEDYIAGRAKWECYIAKLAPFMAFKMAEIDSATPPAH